MMFGFILMEEERENYKGGVRVLYTFIFIGALSGISDLIEVEESWWRMTTTFGIRNLFPTLRRWTIENRYDMRLVTLYYISHERFKLHRGIDIKAADYRVIVGCNLVASNFSFKFKSGNDIKVHMESSYGKCCNMESAAIFLITHNAAQASKYE